MTIPTTDPATGTPVSRHRPCWARLGRAEAEGPDAGVAWHYGDPLREQRRLAAGEAAVDLSNRGVLTVTGPDRLSWLHSMTTQALTGARPGEARETLVLSPHGHVEHDLHLVDDGDDYLAHRRAGHRRRLPTGSTACASCSASRSPT